MAEERPIRVLVVDDNPVNQQVAVAMLSNLGYAPDLASNGEEAVAAVKREPYDLVFMDVQMPVMDGLTATRRIVSEMPADSRPRIVAMTAVVTSIDRQRCIDAGMDGYMTKPISFAGLQDVLEGEARVGGFDRRVVDRLREQVGDEVYDQLARDFVADLPRLSKSIAASAKKKDVAALKETAHELKGLAALFGAVNLTEACTDLLELEGADEGDLGDKVMKAIEMCVEAGALRPD